MTSRNKTYTEEENRKGELEIPLTIHDTLELKGSLFYSEGDQAWNIIRLKKEFLQEFPSLKEKSGKFSYKMIIPKTPSSIKKHLEKMSKDNNIQPIILFLGKVKR